MLMVLSEVLWSWWDFIWIVQHWVYIVMVLMELPGMLSRWILHDFDWVKQRPRNSRPKLHCGTIDLYPIVTNTRIWYWYLFDVFIVWSSAVVMLVVQIQSQHCFLQLVLQVFFLMTVIFPLLVSFMSTWQDGDICGI